MNTAILFDLDGTLLDTAPDFLHAMQLLRTEQHYPLLNKNESDLLKLAVSHGVETILCRGLPEMVIQASTQHPLFHRYLELYQSVIAEHTIFFPGISDLLETLEKAHIPWGIVTNKAHTLTEILLSKIGLRQRASVVVSGDTTPFAKPHPEPLLHASRILQIQPKQCLYIGDAERDIIAGKAAGMTTLAALFGYVDDPEQAKQSWQADDTILHAEDLLPWIQSYWLPQFNEKY